MAPQAPNTAHGGRPGDAEPLRILVADHQEVIRYGIRRIVDGQPNWVLCDEASTGEETTALAAFHQPDILVLDVDIAPDHDIVRAVRAVAPRTEILVFTQNMGEKTARAALAAGARGYLLKSDPLEQVSLAIETVARRRPFLTASFCDTIRETLVRAASDDEGEGRGDLLSSRERQILQLLAEGLSNKQVANELTITVKTVETHRTNIMRKLDAHSIVDIVHYAVRNGIIVV